MNFNRAKLKTPPGIAWYFWNSLLFKSPVLLSSLIFADLVLGVGAGMLCALIRAFQKELRLLVRGNSVML